MNGDFAASFGGFGTGAMFSGKGGCGWVSEAVETLTVGVWVASVFYDLLNLGLDELGGVWLIDFLHYPLL